MRLFIAIDINNQIIAHKVSAIQSLLVDNGVKGTYPSVDQLHITLKFLGETPEHKVQLIDEVLKKIKATDEIVLKINGVGGFPSLKRPRIIYLDVVANDPLYTIQSRIEHEMSRLGFKREGRPFKPHITIFRVKKPWTWRQSLEKELAGIGMDVTIRVLEIKLKESILTPTGPIYRDVSVYKIGD